MSKNPKLNLVVAMCNNRGIGINGTLPWKLRGDMAFFKRITMETTNPDKQNAVIMGRKTWDSIPQKFRPLAKRINIVISRNLKESPEGAHLARSFQEAIDMAQSDALVDKVEGLFVIGGSSLYEMAIESPYCHRIYLTQVMADIECDTFLSKFDTEVFQKTQVEGVDSKLQNENDLNYQFEVYEKSEQVEESR